MIFTAIISKEDDVYIAKCVEVGTTSQGYTIDEALANLKEATELYLEEFPIKNNANQYLLFLRCKRVQNLKTISGAECIKYFVINLTFKIIRQKVVTSY